MVYKDESRIFWVNRREDTYQSFFEQAMKDYFPDCYNDKIKTGNFRLRSFNVQYKIMLDTYQGREHETLEVLKIYPLKTLALEEKADVETFVEYDPNQIILKVNVWRQGIHSLSEEVLEPTQIRVTKDALMDDFMDLLSQRFAIPKASLVIMKRNPMMNTT